jgi:hypothetical protein
MTTPPNGPTPQHLTANAPPHRHAAQLAHRPAVHIRKEQSSTRTTRGCRSEAIPEPVRLWHSQTHLTHDLATDPRRP